jgi:hypothetical protein
MLVQSPCHSGGFIMHDRKTLQIAGAVRFVFWLALVFAFAQFTACGGPSGEPQMAAEAAGTAAASPGAAATLSDEELENLVRRSYQYVAMYNVNNKFAMKQGGWNICIADTRLKDHTMREIARPNNDTLYISCLVDLRSEPMIAEMPAFDSKYVSLMITGYDHYVNVPMSTGQGDFDEPQTMLLFSERSGAYDGQPVEGVERVFEASGDFISAVLRIMPHSNDSERFERIKEQMQAVRLLTLSGFLGAEPQAVAEADFPPVGATDIDVFADNLLPVMQFVLNHTTFDPDDPLDQALLALYAPLGIVPGQAFDPAQVAKLDGERLRAVAAEVQRSEFARAMDPATMQEAGAFMFQPKGEIPLEVLVMQSVTGPIGLPRQEAMYFPVVEVDGQTLNAQYDYVIHMDAEELPPAGPFWSMTLYDSANGFFIPNDRMKYSVGENAGMQLNADGGIDVYIAAEAPEGVPPENWLPINRKDENIDVILRVYIPDLKAVDSWSPPTAQRTGE